MNFIFLAKSHLSSRRQKQKKKRHRKVSNITHNQVRTAIIAVTTVLIQMSDWASSRCSCSGRRGCHITDYRDQVSILNPDVPARRLFKVWSGFEVVETWTGRMPYVQFLSHVAWAGPDLRPRDLTSWPSSPSWSSCSPPAFVYWRGCVGRRSRTCPRRACWHPWLFWFAHQTAEHGPS